MRPSAILLAAALVLVFSSASHSFKLNSDGGYDVSIAIDELAAPNGESYIRELQGVFNTLSIQLFRATKGTFFFRSVNILVPRSWPDVSHEGFATSESFQNADIRISDNAFPYVENPNICGGPGDSIHLPTSFFTTKNNGVYGETWKALMTQWARYRWGVWEEHGMPGDSRFPYFHKATPDATSWSTTGCSDVPIIGEFVDEFGETTLERCNPENVAVEMNETCRFQPSRTGNKATTSLMHFHFMETVTDFCDETNHVRTSPNKQNEFCGHKSVWEVMRGTPDFKAVLNKIPIDEIPLIQFRKIRTDDKPVLYVLLDKGSAALTEVLVKLNGRFAQLFNRAEVNGILTALGTFPSQSGDSYVQEHLSWAPISEDNRRDYMRVIQEPLKPDAPSDRDFGRAILEVVETLKNKNSPGGAVLVVVKTGAGKGSFNLLAYEEEVRGALLNTQIKLVALELQTSVSAPYVNLNSLATWNGGSHYRINGGNIDTTIIEDAIEKVSELVTSPIAPVDKSLLVYKGLVKPNEWISMIHTANLTRLEFSLTYPNNTDIILSVDGDTSRPPRHEWDEATDMNLRLVKSGHVEFTDPSVILNGGVWDFGYNCKSPCPNLEAAQLVIYGTFQNAVEPIAEDVNVATYTSAFENFVDLNETKSNDSPFSIFARVTVDGVPVKYLNTTAFLQQIGGTQNGEVQLRDDGLGPDLTKDDGIYSGTYIPTADSSYKINVRVVNSQIRDDPPASVRLLPIDQQQLVGESPPISLKKIIQTSVDLPTPVTFVNNALIMRGKPTKVRDMLANFDEAEVGVRVQFTTPTILGMSSGVGVQYTVYVGNSLEELLGDLSNPNLTAYFQSTNKPPGSSENFIVQHHSERPIFIGILTLHGAFASEMSNIRSVVIPETVIPSDSPSTDTTTVTPPASNPTTDDPIDVTTQDSITVGPSEPTQPSDGTTGPEQTTTSSASTPTTTAPPEEDKKPFFETGWGIVVIVVIVLVVLATGGGIFYYCYRSRGCYSTKESGMSIRPSSRSDVQPRPASAATTNP